MTERKKMKKKLLHLYIAPSEFWTAGYGASNQENVKVNWKSSGISLPPVDKKSSQPVSKGVEGLARVGSRAALSFAFAFPRRAWRSGMFTERQAPKGQKHPPAGPALGPGHPAGAGCAERDAEPPNVVCHPVVASAVGQRGPGDGK
ncbi:uncharacterized protein LOC129013819 isoform X2 [Pongo pygmaeus]|uniref:uncharacterized protein LOC129013819 isoform X2 n=1 Tax=Pongo pygmaeus TaxID=9600 RepID=UPI00300C8CED